jgi:hypothetical protein
MVATPCGLIKIALRARSLSSRLSKLVALLFRSAFAMINVVPGEEKVKLDLSLSCGKLSGLVFLACSILLAPFNASGQFVMMPDSTNNRLVLFDAFNGSLVNGNYFSLQGGTSVHALQVNNEIWVSEQVGDRISRWSLTGSHLGNIGGQFAGGGMDNIRGMALINNTIYVTNAGTANNAPGNGLVLFNTSGNNLGSIVTSSTSPSPFGIIASQGGMLVSSSSANDDIHRYDLAGNSLGTFHNSTTVNFAQQMAFRSNGNLLVGAFSVPSGIYELDPFSGSVVASYALTNALRGVYELGNGNILWTSAAGAFVLDPLTNSSTQVYNGGGRYLDYVDLNPIPEPTAGVILAALVAVNLLRRRKSDGVSL